MSAWTEAELASKRRLRRPEPVRAVHWWDQRQSRVAEATSRADVLGGQLAEASGWSAELSGPDSWRRPWQRWPGRGADVVLRSGDPPTVLPSEARSDFAEGVVDAEGAAAPSNCQGPSLQDRFILYWAYVFCGRRGPDILSVCCKAAFLFLLFRVSGLICR